MSWGLQDLVWANAAGAVHRQESGPHEGQKSLNIDAAPLGMQGVRLTTWCHAGDDDDYYDAELMQLLSQIGELTLGHSVVIPFDLPFLSEEEREGAKVKRDRDGDGPLGDDVARWAQLLWHYLTSEISVTRPAQVERHSRARAKRAGLTHDVSVVTLRRKHYIGEPPEEHQHREFTCRWPVDPFLRHLDRYKGKHHLAVAAHLSLPGEKHDYCLVCWDNDEIIRITGVRSHLRGPLDKPLRDNRNKLWKLVR
jgi:hypothetical protein